MNICRKIIEGIKIHSEKLGLQLNLQKTKMMTNHEQQRHIKMDNGTIGYVTDYVFLGQIIKCGR